MVTTIHQMAVFNIDFFGSLDVFNAGLIVEFIDQLLE